MKDLWPTDPKFMENVFILFEIYQQVEVEVTGYYQRKVYSIQI